LIVDDQRIKIEHHELEKEGISYSRDTLDFLSAEYPQHTFAWVIGSDNLTDFHKWHDNQGRDFKDLLHHYPFYVYPRQGFPLDPLYDNMVPLKKVTEIAVSSTEVRDRVKAGQSIEHLADPAVAEYIHAQHLYVE
jgi:nicotinate-nucleotide adenylyltransferase